MDQLLMYGEHSDNREATMKLGSLGVPVKNGPPPLYPLIKINHTTGCFTADTVDGMGANFGKRLDFIALGLLRSRSYWLDGLAVRKRVACQSHDAIHGIPHPNLYPWDESPFAQVDSNAVLSCSECPFTGWYGAEKNIRCKQTWTLPVLLREAHISTSDQVYLIPFSASSISNLTEYMRPYRDSGTPTYTTVTRCYLSKVRKGSNTWCEASFEEAGDAPVELFDKFSGMLNKVKRELQQQQQPSKKITSLPLQQ